MRDAVKWTHIYETSRMHKQVKIDLDVKKEMIINKYFDKLYIRRMRDKLFFNTDILFVLFYKS